MIDTKPVEDFIFESAVTVFEESENLAIIDHRVIFVVDDVKLLILNFPRQTHDRGEVDVNQRISIDIRSIQSVASE